ncbi:folylpolyglutamate synthase/dihydrofolate synthase family protein [Desulfuromonas acetoxidans]|uniref:bifunctional folylpolyglutamate synthase/dihydrofolate synthase n=1 Tax=Desulfuromonas acetoxidans TaxID=891 RepID=UPI00292F0CB2|nr:folylpolyglutamate synthase/dihydrofolate synthase family protein [Desulfuromonas acetoxidans]
MKTPDAALEFLYGLQMFGIKLGLENIQTLVDSVGQPQRNYGIVHVAGTNGKGSVCAFLGRIYRQAGYRVGVYTSPHLHRFNERIRVNGQPIDDHDLVALVDELRQKNSEVPATFFEFTTALALLYFARQNVDLVILEVGMGGRLDATNVVAPLVSVITPVSDDHGDYLGGSLAEIAAEKGGIIKPGVPVVIGPQDKAAMAVLSARAKEMAAPCLCFGRDFSVEKTTSGCRVTTGALCWSELQPSLPGRHQYDNLAVALMVVTHLAEQGWQVTQQVVREAVADTRWPGRLEWVGERILLDGAHNASGAHALADYLRGCNVQRIHWVAGFKADKDMEAVVSSLLPFVVQAYCVEPPTEQAYPRENVVVHLQQHGCEASAWDSPTVALEAALQQCGDHDLVVVAGSLFLVAACRDWLISTCNLEEMDEANCDG